MICPAAVDLREGSPSCSLWYPADRFGIRARSLAWISRYLQDLVDLHDFPRPFPTYPHNRGAERLMTERVVPTSRWDKAAVDAWFTDRLPPELGAVMGAAEQARFAHELDTRAEAMAA